MTESFYDIVCVHTPLLSVELSSKIFQKNYSKASDMKMNKNWIEKLFALPGKNQNVSNKVHISSYKVKTVGHQCYIYFVKFRIKAAKCTPTPTRTTEPTGDMENLLSLVKATHLENMNLLQLHYSSKPVFISSSWGYRS